MTNTTLVIRLLVGQYYDRTLRYLYKIYRSSPLANDGTWDDEIEEDVEDTFLVMAVKGTAKVDDAGQLFVVRSDGYQPEDGFIVVRAYAWRIAESHIRREIRRLIRGPSHVDPKSLPDLAGENEPGKDEDWASALWEFIQYRVAPAQMRLLKLCYLDQLSPAEIAADEETSVGAIRSRLSRAIRELRNATDEVSRTRFVDTLKEIERKSL